MSATRTIAACFVSVEAERRREYDPTYAMDRQIAQARREMGEARWAELHAEWEAPAPIIPGRFPLASGQGGNANGPDNHMALAAVDHAYLYDPHVDGPNIKSREAARSL